MAKWLAALSLANFPLRRCRPRRPGEPIRLSIVSSFYYSHSNWKIPIKGWIGLGAASI